MLADRHKYVGYGGARGGGKSWAIRVKAILLARRWPGIKICLVRQTYKDLLSAVKKLIEIQLMQKGDEDKGGYTLRVEGFNSEWQE